METLSPAVPRARGAEIAVWRLYLLRAGYLLIAAGMGMQIVPASVSGFDALRTGATPEELRS